jgi:hypothetical protein
MASAEALLPEGFRLKRASGTLTISWRGPTHWIFVAAGTSGAVLSAILLTASLLASQGLTGAPFLFGLALLLSVYVMLVGVCNRTRIRICEDRLRAENGPLPCIFPSIFQVGCKKGIPLDQVRGIRIEKEPQEDPPEGRLPTYAFHTDMRDSTVETLLTRMEEEGARSLGQVLAQAGGLAVTLPAEEPRIGAVCRLRRR